MYVHIYNGAERCSTSSKYVVYPSRSCCQRIQAREASEHRTSMPNYYDGRAWPETMKPSDQTLKVGFTGPCAWPGDRRHETYCTVCTTIGGNGDRGLSSYEQPSVLIPVPKVGGRIPCVRGFHNNLIVAARAPVPDSRGMNIV